MKDEAGHILKDRMEAGSALLKTALVEVDIRLSGAVEERSIRVLFIKKHGPLLSFLPQAVRPYQVTFLIEEELDRIPDDLCSRFLTQRDQRRRHKEIVKP